MPPIGWLSKHDRKYWGAGALPGSTPPYDYKYNTSTEERSQEPYYNYDREPMFTEPEDTCGDGCGCDMFCAQEQEQARVVSRGGKKRRPSMTKPKPAGRIKCTNKTTKYKLVKLGELELGETFRFLAGVNSQNVYMVIGSDPGKLPGKAIRYVLLGTGAVFEGTVLSKEVVRVQCELSYVDVG